MDHVTVHKQSDRMPADLKQDVVPKVIEERIYLAEYNCLFASVQHCEGKFQRLCFTIKSYSKLPFTIRTLHLPDIPGFIDGTATHAQHGHKCKLFGQSQRVRWSETWIDKSFH